MSSTRSGIRNTRFYDAANPKAPLGGLCQNGSITEANFLSILKILIVPEGKPVRAQERISGHVVTENNMSLVAGDYDIYCDDPIQVTNEPWVQRLSFRRNTPDRETIFQREVRTRDKKCVITGIANSDIQIQLGIWAERESLWIQYGYDQLITDMGNATGSSKIDSVQNGFLLNPTAQQLFDQYLISINPDDGYKVVVFGNDIFGYDGRTLDPVCRNPADPHSLSDQVLRWHFRQSVLANIRGVGEPIFEHDFPPGTDMVDEILAGPFGKERFEFAIATRLRGVA
ncbi:hypothetical protein B9Z19DRAFT_1152524 [Tuber borchii]|uniref:Uncharacterized protein n=1 Tax=Tuber borchii TaxID=42251 RepID=A0A2T6ZJN5_TUBBO|nr:hypothetical protein B9Z19DRAFT_1152524 [Tuber borchii]